MAPIEVPMTQSGTTPASLQRLVDAGLVCPERAAALQHQHDLATRPWRDGLAVPSAASGVYQRQGPASGPPRVGLSATRSCASPSRLIVASSRSSRRRPAGSRP